MKILHMADTHLGYAAYRKVTTDGLNQREIDIYNSFKQCIDYAITSKPDLIVHAGDLFDSVRPTNRAINIALEQINRLSHEQIPFIVISGNHETPKLKETGNIFTIFRHLKHIYPVYQNQYEKLFFDIKNKKICIHALPHCQTKEVFLENLKEIKPEKSADFNLFMAHGAVKGIKEFKMNEFNELFIPIETLSNEFDYIALGHYHKYTKIAENAFYSGSSERLSFAEADSKKGLIEIEIGQNTKQQFITIDTRLMIDTDPIMCSTLTIEEITDQIQGIIQTVKPKNKIVRIKLEKIPSHLYRSIDFNHIRSLSKGAVHFEIKSDIVTEGGKKIDEQYTITSIGDEFKQFLNDKDISDKKLLLNLGLEYIEKIESKDEGK